MITFFKLAIFISVMGLTRALNRSQLPVPHAAELDNILNRFLNNTELSGNIFGYLFNNGSKPPADFDLDNLEINVLTATNFKKIVDKVKRKYLDKKIGTRRLYESENYDEGLIMKSLDLMRQSIYSTRYRMRDTKKYRQKFGNDYSYNIALMYGAMMVARQKMERLYAMTHAVPLKTHFIWHLIIYEKTLAYHTDICNMVETLYVYHKRYAESKKKNT